MGARLTRGGRWLWIGLGLLVVALFVIALRAAGSGGERRAYDPRSSESNGTRALFLWLEQMGYRVETIPQTRFALPDNADALLLFPGLEPYADAEAQRLAAWVNGGHTLALVAADEPAIEEVLKTRAPSYVGSIADAGQVQPLLPETPSRWLEIWGDSGFPAPVPTDAIPVLAHESGDATLLVQAHGGGTVWSLAGVHAPINATLRNSHQAAIVAAILRTVPPGGTILFDAYHFYGPIESVARIETLQDFVYRTPAGRALLFALGALALYLLLAGRRLGPPLPNLQETRRREAAEYVRAMAGLKRRAHTAPDVAAHHRQRLKSALARTRALDPRVDDRAFAQRLRAHTAVDGSLDAAALAEVERLLAALAAPKDERALVEAAAAVDGFLAEYR